MAIDAVDLLYTSPVDTFVIVSSDSYFVPLVSKLRAAGKTVLGAGEQNKAPSMLVKSCDRYFFLDQDRISTGKKSIAITKEQDVNNLIQRAIMASIDEYGRVVGSKLHQTMLRLDPSFDYRSYGYSTFTQLLEASTSLKLIRSRGPGDVTIELLDQASTVTKESLPEEGLWEQINSAWLKRSEKYGSSIPGPIAASEAAIALGVNKLSASRYKTLQGLLDSSGFLAEKWSRKGNTIIKR